MTYEDYIVKSIINCIPFNISTVTDVTIIGTTAYNEPNFNLVCSSLQKGNLPNFTDMDSEEKPFEDLTVVSFKNQDGVNYCGVVYDSWALEQDPEVQRVYPIKAGA